MKKLIKKITDILLFEVSDDWLDAIPVVMLCIILSPVLLPLAICMGIVKSLTWTVKTLNKWAATAATP